MKKIVKSVFVAAVLSLSM